MIKEIRKQIENLVNKKHYDLIDNIFDERILSQYVIVYLSIGESILLSALKNKDDSSNNRSQWYKEHYFSWVLSFKNGKEKMGLDSDFESIFAFKEFNNIRYIDINPIFKDILNIHPYSTNDYNVKYFSKYDNNEDLLHVIVHDKLKIKEEEIEYILIDKDCLDVMLYMINSSLERWVQYWSTDISELAKEKYNKDWILHIDERNKTYPFIIDVYNKYQKQRDDEACNRYLQEGSFEEDKFCDYIAYNIIPSVLRANKEDQNKYNKFLEYDKNTKSSEISCNPEELSNYSNIHINPNPHQLSVAYFDIEVLNKYKSNREKYRLEDHSLNCGNAGYLKSYYIQENTGQVHAYLKDLSELSYKEQLHFKSHNKERKKSIDEYVFIADFEGHVPSDSSMEGKFPLAELRQSMDSLVKVGNIFKKDDVTQINLVFNNNPTDYEKEISNLYKYIIESINVNYINKKYPELKERKLNRIELIMQIMLQKGATKSITDEIRLIFKKLNDLRNEVSDHKRSSKDKILQEERLKYGTLDKSYRNLVDNLTKALNTLKDYLKGE